MPILREEDKQTLREHFSKNLENPVKILMFTQHINCEYCQETEAILKEVSELSDSVSLEIKNFVSEKDAADRFGIKRVPATLILKDDQTENGIKFYGIPSGYEFTSLVETIVMVSRKGTNLKEDTKTRISAIDKPLDIKVFVTPTCPYCPAMVVLAHKFALQNSLIKSSMIEANEFLELSRRYGVHGVPKTVLNDTISFEGAVPEKEFVEHLEKAMSAAENKE